MLQVQCPNDGSYKVRVETTIIDRKNGKTVVNPGWGGWIFIAVFFAASIAMIFVIHPFCGIVEILVCLLLAWGLHSMNNEYAKAVKIQKYDCECIICGYKWTRRADEPLPQVTVRPDLIAKGEQRLEEERRIEQERRDREGWMRLHDQYHRK